MTTETRVVTLRSREMIDNEAAEWLVKLDGGNLSDTDRRDLKVWLRQNSDHVRALKEITYMWSELDVLLNDFPTVDNSKPSNTLSVFIPSIRLSLAMAMVLLATVGVITWTNIQPVTNENLFYVTSVGNQGLKIFSDGSIAHINTNSMLETEYTKTSRIVRLLRGEAMFDVAHDPDRPFIVYVGNREVKAIGTKFIVRLTSEIILVTVADGQVQLSRRQMSGDSSSALRQQEVFLISKGEEVEVEEESKALEKRVVPEDDIQRRLSWTKGLLVFENERLEHVIKEISRYVPNQIVIDDPELREVRISGRFDIGDTEALLEAIEVSFNVQAKHIEEQVIHLSR